MRQGGNVCHVVQGIATELAAVCGLFAREGREWGNSLGPARVCAAQGREMHGATAGRQFVWVHADGAKPGSFQKCVDFVGRGHGKHSSSFVG